MNKINKKNVLKGFILSATIFVSVPVMAASTVDLYEHTHREKSSQMISMSHSSYSESSSNTTKKVSNPRITKNSLKGAVYSQVPHINKNNILVETILPKPKLLNYETGDIRPTTFLNQGALAIFKKDKQLGILDIKGNVLVPARYKILKPLENGILQAGNKKNELTFIAPDGRELSKSELADINMQYDISGLRSFKENGKYGFKDEFGNVVISADFSRINTEFSEGIAFVTPKTGQTIAIDEKGNALFVAPSSEMGVFKNGIAEYVKHVNNINGKSIWTTLITDSLNKGSNSNIRRSIKSYYDGVKRGFIDRSGRIIIDSTNDQVSPMTPFGAFVKNKGLTSFVSPTGETIIPAGQYSVEVTNNTDGLGVLRAHKSDRMGVVDLSTGNMLVPFMYDSIQLLGHDRMIVTTNNRTYFANARTGEKIRELDSRATVVPFDNMDVTWLFIKDYTEAFDVNGKTLFTFAEGIKDMDCFRNGFAPVRVKNKWGLMTPEGKWLITPQYDDIEIL